MKKATLLLAFLMTFFLVMVGCQQKESSIAKTNNVTDPEKGAVGQCENDVKICPNGRSVSRNIKNSCEFDPCRKTKFNKEPSVKALKCTDDVKECHDGSFAGRDPYNQCKFKLCPPTKNGRSENSDN